MGQLSFKILKLVAFSGMLATMGAGCVAEPPTTALTHPGGGGDMAMQPGVKPDMTPVNPGTANPPVLDPMDTATPYATIPVHGTAQPGTEVLFVSDQGDTVHKKVDSTGRFCIDTPLVDGQENYFHATVIDTFGNQSMTVDFSVTQSGTPQQQEAPPMAQNAALGGVAKSNYLGSQTDSNVVDGNAATFIEGRVTNPDFWSINGPAPSVVVKLSAPSRINKIQAVAPADCLFAKPMEIWYSSADAPSPPNIDKTGWTKATSAQISTDMTLAFAALPTSIASYVAVVWPGGSDFGQLGNCGTIYPNFGVAELQAWTVPGAAPPAPRDPSCGGSN